MVSSDKLSDILSKYSICLSINAPNYAHAFGTKIFDYMALRKRILHISNGGELYDVLKKNNQRVARYDSQEVKEVLLNLDSFNANMIDYSFTEIFDLKFQAKKITKLFV